MLSYRELRDEAKALARRLLGLGLERGDRVGILAETDPMFHRFLFRLPVRRSDPPLPCPPEFNSVRTRPISIRFAGCSRAVVQPLRSCRILMPTLPERSHRVSTWSWPVHPVILTPWRKSMLISLRKVRMMQLICNTPRAVLVFPRGVEIDQETALDNLQEIARHGLKLTSDDRFVSWLPYYHDMGLIGFILAPLICQLSVDYLPSRTFAMRPRLWLKLISDNRGNHFFQSDIRLCAVRQTAASFGLRTV